MISVLKDALRMLGLPQFVRRRVDLLKSYYKLPRGATVLVHIGKCGGRSVKQALEKATQNSDVFVVHGRAPIWRKDLKYIIVARDPLSRLVSAFHWRYKKVVKDGMQRKGHEAEYRVFEKYSDLDELAESLYGVDGTLNRSAQSDMHSVGHVRKGLSFYLKALLRKCRPDQIIAVLMQETLDEDIQRVFGSESAKREHFNPGNPGTSGLTEAAAASLRRWLSPDYEVLMKLYCWGKIEEATFVTAISDADRRMPADNRS